MQCFAAEDFTIYAPPRQLDGHALGVRCLACEGSSCDAYRVPVELRGAAQTRRHRDWSRRAQARRRTRTAAPAARMGDQANYGREILKRQLLALTKNPPEGISVGLADDDDMYTWEVMIIGPDGTLYEGGM